MAFLSMPVAIENAIDLKYCVIVSFAEENCNLSKNNLCLFFVNIGLSVIERP